MWYLGVFEKTNVTVDYAFKAGQKFFIVLIHKSLKYGVITLSVRVTTSVTTRCHNVNMGFQKLTVASLDLMSVDQRSTSEPIDKPIFGISLQHYELFWVWI